MNLSFFEKRPVSGRGCRILPSSSDDAQFEIIDDDNIPWKERRNIPLPKKHSIVAPPPHSTNPPQKRRKITHCLEKSDDDDDGGDIFDLLDQMDKCEGNTKENAPFQPDDIHNLSSFLFSISKNGRIIPIFPKNVSFKWNLSGFIKCDEQGKGIWTQLYETSDKVKIIKAFGYKKNNMVLLDRQGKLWLLTREQRHFITINPLNGVPFRVKEVIKFDCGGIDFILQPVGSTERIAINVSSSSMIKVVLDKDRVVISSVRKVSPFQILINNTTVCDMSSIGGFILSPSDKQPVASCEQSMNAKTLRIKEKEWLDKNGPETIRFMECITIMFNERESVLKVFNMINLESFSFTKVKKWLVHKNTLFVFYRDERDRDDFMFINGEGSSVYLLDSSFIAAKQNDPDIYEFLVDHIKGITWDQEGDSSVVFASTNGDISSNEGYYIYDTYGWLKLPPS